MLSKIIKKYGRKYFSQEYSKKRTRITHPSPVSAADDLKICQPSVDPAQRVTEAFIRGDAEALFNAVHETPRFSADAFNFDVGDDFPEIRVEVAEMLNRDMSPTVLPYIKENMVSNIFLK